MHVGEIMLLVIVTLNNLYQHQKQNSNPDACHLIAQVLPAMTSSLLLMVTHLVPVIRCFPTRQLPQRIRLVMFCIFPQSEEKQEQ